MSEEKKTNQDIKKENLLGDFILFIKGFGVIGLALGVVIGGATNTLVQSLTINIINPLLGYLIPDASFTGWTLGQVQIGAFISSLISFVILMFIVYFSVKLFVSRFLTEAEKEKVGIK